jgi:phage terminase large subunit-like protein
MIEMDPELRRLFKVYRWHIEVPSTGTILRVLSSDAGLQQGLSPSFVCFDEVAVQPNDRLWNVMTLGSGTRTQPLTVGISTPGWERDSLAHRLYAHGKKTTSGEIEDPTFFFRRWEPADPEVDHTDPKVWAEANPALGHFLFAADFEAALGTTPEHEFRRFRLGQWTTTKDAALPAGAWASLEAPRDVPNGTSVIVGFEASSTREAIALVACTLDGFLFPIEIEEEAGRVDPANVAEAIRQTCSRYDVREIACHEHAWTWVLLSLEGEYLPVVAIPRSPARSVKAWQLFSDAIMEERITHDGDPRLARHIADLTIRSDRFGSRPDLDRLPGSPISAALAAMWAASRVLEKQVEPENVPGFIWPWDDDEDDLDRYFEKT